MMIRSNDRAKCRLTVFKPCGLDLLIDSLYSLVKDKPISYIKKVKKGITGDFLRITLNEQDNVVLFYCSWEKEAIAQLKYLT